MSLPQANRMQRFRTVWLLLTGAVLLLGLPGLAMSQVCGTPGADGTTFARNTYFPGAASAALGATSVSIGAARVDANASTTPFAIGDLALIMQMQDANINNTDTDSYGDGVAGEPANGSSNLRRAGRYEFKLVTGIAAGSISFAEPLGFAYTNQDAGTNNGNRRFQVIRVPQFASLTLPGGTLGVTAWNGATGGVFVLDVSGILNLNGTTINADAVGFRGGGSQEATSFTGANVLDFRAAQAAGTPPANRGAAKGEGIAGTPRFVRGAAVPYSGTDLGVSGYPSSFDLARGAPGNAGGGGTQHNSGGGGGGNVGAGGRGGRSFGRYNANNINASCVMLTSIIGGTVYYSCDGDGTRDVGGYGGFGITPPSGDLIVIGGGGGAGESNNSGDNPAVAQNAGGNGGGMIFVHARTITGTGSFQARGQAGLPAGRDGAGGGGSGGTVVVISESTSVPGLSADARGGNGGNSGQPLRSNETQGTGGGGGGGAILLSPSLSIGSVNVAGGTPGVNEPVNNIQNTLGATAGLGGVANVPFSGDEFPNSSACYPALTVTKSTSTPLRIIPTDTTAQYTITVSNAASGGSATGVAVTDVFPVPFTYSGGAVAAALSAAVGPNPATPVSGTSTVIVGTAGGTVANSYRILPGGSVAFTVPVNLNGAGIGTYQNPATVNYSDPTRAATGAQTTSPGGSYANPGPTVTVPGSNYNSASSTAEDITINGAANLQVIKTNSVTGLVSGATTIYTLTVSNAGPLGADGANLTDAPSAGLSLQSVTCGSPSGGAVCPVGPLTVAALTVGGIAIPTLPSGGSVVFTVTALVTATGL